MSVCPYCTGQTPPNVAVCPICGRKLQLSVAPQVSRWKTINWRWAVPISIIAAVVWGLGSVLWSGVQQAREAARRTSCNCRIKQFGLAFHNYHEQNGCFPPAWIADSQGRPIHSWRVLLLPYLDQAALYGRYNFAEPWDGPNNIKLLDEIPSIYKCPSHAPRPRKAVTVSAAIGLFACGDAWPGGFSPDKCTDYAAVLGKECVFCGARPVAIKDITDGTSNTVMIGEVTDVAIPWTKPADIEVKLHLRIGDRMGFSSEHGGLVNFLYVDGSVARLRTDMPQSLVDALFTRASGDNP